MVFITCTVFASTVHTLKRAAIASGRVVGASKSGMMILRHCTQAGTRISGVKSTKLLASSSISLDRMVEMSLLGMDRGFSLPSHFF